MFLASFPAGPFGTNCYLVAPREGADVVVIDPGMTASETIRAELDERGVGVAGVLVTHGHIDHVASLADVAEHWSAPVWIHEAERELLSPEGTILPDSLRMAMSLGARLAEPADLRCVGDGAVIEVGGLTFGVRHAPGHRPGCLLFSLPLGDIDEQTAVFTGDVLFAGSIGRTDLPGGDAATMASTLRDVVLGLPDDWIALPGHGEQTTIGAERASNYFLTDRFLRTL